MSTVEAEEPLRSFLAALPMAASKDYCQQIFKKNTVMSKNKIIFILQGTNRGIIFFFVTLSVLEHFQRLEEQPCLLYIAPRLSDPL